MKPSLCVNEFLNSDKYISPAFVCPNTRGKWSISNISYFPANNRMLSLILSRRSEIVHLLIRNDMKSSVAFELLSGPIEEFWRKVQSNSSGKASEFYKNSLIFRAWSIQCHSYDRLNRHFNKFSLGEPPELIFLKM